MNLARSLQRFCAILLVLVLQACSSPRDNAPAAEALARQWVEANVDRIAGELANHVAKDYSALARPVIAMLLQNGMQWRFTPSRRARDRWVVTVTASNSIDLSKIRIDQIAQVAGSIDVEIDTDRQAVLGHSFNSSASHMQLVAK